MSLTIAGELDGIADDDYDDDDEYEYDMRSQQGQRRPPPAWQAACAWLLPEAAPGAQNVLFRQLRASPALSYPCRPELAGAEQVEEDEDGVEVRTLRTAQPHTSHA